MDIESQVVRLRTSPTYYHTPENYRENPHVILLSKNIVKNLAQWLYTVQSTYACIIFFGDLNLY